MLMLVMWHGMRLTLAGLALGLPAALASARVLSSSVYDVGWLDPSIFVAPVIVIGGVAVLACLLPAFRAVGIDPMKTLREE
jgi:ABC-type antimicrobial peptide transport system permease subunit